jgi:hypothetical protein
MGDVIAKHSARFLDGLPPMAGVEISLRDGVDALLMSAVWRTAGLGFLRGSRNGWTRRELGRWLVGPYRDATSEVPRIDAESFGDASRRIDEETIASVVREAREEVVLALRNSPHLVATAMRDHAIVPTGDGIWIPLDRPRMRLAERVRSLFAADYLLRPQDYERDLTICAKCEGVVFDATARQTGCCGADRISGFLELFRHRQQPSIQRIAS